MTLHLQDSYELMAMSRLPLLEPGSTVTGQRSVSYACCEPLCVVDDIKRRKSRVALMRHWFQLSHRKPKVGSNLPRGPSLEASPSWSSYFSVLIVLLCSL